MDKSLANMNGLGSLKGLGNQVGYYGLNKAYKIIIWGAAIVVLVNIFALWHGSSNKANTMRDAIQVMMSVLLALLIYTLYILRISKVWLYESGLVVRRANDEAIVRFDEIADVYEYIHPSSGSSKGFSFRTEDSENWSFISELTANYPALRRQFFARHAQQRSAVLLERLAQGKTVIFHTLSNSVKPIKGPVDFNSYSQLMKEIALNSDSLSIDGQRYPLSTIAGLQENWLTDCVSIVDTRGQTLFSTHINAILSANVLQAALFSLCQVKPQRAEALIFHE